MCRYLSCVSGQKAIGLSAIDLVYPDEWATVREAGLICSMGYASPAGGGSLKRGSTILRITEC